VRAARALVRRESGTHPNRPRSPLLCIFPFSLVSRDFIEGDRRWVVAFDKARGFLEGDRISMGAGLGVRDFATWLRHGFLRREMVCISRRVVGKSGWLDRPFWRVRVAKWSSFCDRGPFHLVLLWVGRLLAETRRRRASAGHEELFVTSCGHRNSDCAWRRGVSGFSHVGWHPHSSPTRRHFSGQKNIYGG
jgi:hypothetical protein